MADFGGVPLTGGSVVVTVSGTSTGVAVPKTAKGFWVHASAAAWLTFNTAASAITSLDNTKATPLAGGVLYGPFELPVGQGGYVHVGGNGGTPTVTVTFA